MPMHMTRLTSEMALNSIDQAYIKPNMSTTIIRIVIVIIAADLSSIFTFYAAI